MARVSSRARSFGKSTPATWDAEDLFPVGVASAVASAARAAPRVWEALGLTVVTTKGVIHGEANAATLSAAVIRRFPESADDDRCTREGSSFDASRRRHIVLVTAARRKTPGPRVMRRRVIARGGLHARGVLLVAAQVAMADPTSRVRPRDGEILSGRGGRPSPRDSTEPARKARGRGDEGLGRRCPRPSPALGRVARDGQTRLDALGSDGPASDSCVRRIMIFCATIW